MIASPLAEKHYGSARKRFLQSSIERFLDREFPRTFGPVIRHKLAEHLVALVDLGVDKGIDPLATSLVAHCGGHLFSTGGQFIEDRDVKVSIDRHGQGTWDRRSAHGQ